MIIRLGILRNIPNDFINRDHKIYDVRLFYIVDKTIRIFVQF